MSGRGITYTHPLLFHRYIPTDILGYRMLSQLNPWSDLVWLFLYGKWSALQVSSAFQWHTFIFFHLSHNSFSSVFTLKTKVSTLQISAPPFYQNPKIPLWSHTFPSLLAYLTQMWKVIKNYGCSSRTESIPVQYLPHAVHWICSQGFHWCFHNGTLQLILHLIFQAAFNITKYFSLSLSISVFALLSLSYLWKDREALSTFTLQDSTPILR